MGTGDSGFESRHPDKMGKQFAKNKEDFTCDHCGYENIGDGYTNHCRECLWSKHVDNMPGDRESACRGIMEPVGVEGSTGGKTKEDYRILHRCTVCGYEKINRMEAGDNEETVLSIIKKNAAKI